MNVELAFADSDIGRIVRFQRETTVPLTGRPYIDTDLIIVIDPVHEKDLRDDFERYRQLDQDQQKEFIQTLKWSRYTGRLLKDIPDDKPQGNLF